MYIAAADSKSNRVRSFGFTIIFRIYDTIVCDIFVYILFELL